MEASGSYSWSCYFDCKTFDFLILVGHEKEIEQKEFP